MVEVTNMSFDVGRIIRDESGRETNVRDMFRERIRFFQVEKVGGARVSFVEMFETRSDKSALSFSFKEII